MYRKSRRVSRPKGALKNVKMMVATRYKDGGAAFSAPGKGEALRLSLAREGRTVPLKYQRMLLPKGRRRFFFF